MSRFFVGQRVRLVRPVKRIEKTGATGRIRGFNPSAVVPGVGAISVVLVDWDDGERDGPRRLGFSGWATDPNSIEPILPSGHRAGDYSLSDLLDRCRAGEGVVV